MSACPWNGQACDCQDFPWKVDGLIPLKCQKNIGLDMVPVRAVRPPLKALHQLWLREIANKTYNPDDPKWDIRT
jgi:hypothetical protein